MPDRPNGVPSYPAPRCPVAPPCGAPTRPARGVSGFWIRQVGFQQSKYIIVFLWLKTILKQAIFALAFPTRPSSPIFILTPRISFVPLEIRVVG